MFHYLHANAATAASAASAAVSRGFEFADDSAERVY